MESFIFVEYDKLYYHVKSKRDFSIALRRVKINEKNRQPLDLVF